MGKWWGGQAGERNAGVSVSVGTQAPWFLLSRSILSETDSTRSARRQRPPFPPPSSPSVPPKGASPVRGGQLPPRLKGVAHRVPRGAACDQDVLLNELVVDGLGCGFGFDGSGLVGWIERRPKWQ